LESKQTAYYKTPIGTAKIVGDENGVSSVSVLDEEIETSQNIPTCLKDCIQQLDEYFIGKRAEFDLKLNQQGTLFQQK